MTRIKDVVIPTKPIGKLFTIKVINIELPGTNATFYWEVKSEGKDPDTNLPIPGETILDGNLFMSTSEYNQWGSDDNYVIDWALNQLNLQKI